MAFQIKADEEINYSIILVTTKLGAGELEPYLITDVKMDSR